MPQTCVPSGISIRYLMNAPTSSSAGAEKLLSSVEAEISRLVEQKTPNAPTQSEAEAERIKAAIARLTSNSIDGLEGLMSELQQLQVFLLPSRSRAGSLSPPSSSCYVYCHNNHSTSRDLRRKTRQPSEDAYPGGNPRPGYMGYTGVVILSWLGTKMASAMPQVIGI